MEVLAGPEPLPAGGAAGALVAALAAALAEMGGTRSTKYEIRSTGGAAEMPEVARRAREVRAALIRAIDEDVAAYRAYLDARRLPRGDEAQRRAREAAIGRAALAATRAPLGVARLAGDVLDLLGAVAARGNPNLLGDAAMGAELAAAALRGSTLDVRLNLRGHVDMEESAALLAEADALDAAAERRRAAIVARAREALA
ncbi:MAG TPA: cyclodeaminase/cyclohydrolase family protein [Thermomicrobiales bacterium]|nr:cyclodeaminase/cyclohydrolase family protein [Thermomicrobiales bacterium]